MERIRCPETSVNYDRTLCNNPEKRVTLQYKRLCSEAQTYQMFGLETSDLLVYDSLFIGE